MAETANAEVNEPDNSAAVDYMRTRLQLLKSPPVVLAVEPTDADTFGE
jgi:hypothetical protein